jgi:uncharacterized protein (DUF488 family)
MSSCVLFTIGYECRRIDEFVSYLKSFNISRLIDVREIPISRKPGFSKKTLQQKLEDEDIIYIHMKALGSPSPIRKKLKADLDYDHFFKAYGNYLAHQMEAIKEVHNFIFDGRSCIMCFEHSPEKCHRSAVANKVKEYNGNGLKIIHI